MQVEVAYRFSPTLAPLAALEPTRCRLQIRRPSAALPKPSMAAVDMLAPAIPAPPSFGTGVANLLLASTGA